ncbi:MAG: hypothetical protein Q4C60_01945 [Eubacteriales bacterium]|nr:hypothetical protein [Eubacteriales bacterium]
MIVCEPTSGLTSRSYVLADAYALAKKYGQKLIVIWQKTSDCNCFYEEVFDQEQFSDIPHRIYNCNKFEYKINELKQEGGARSLFMIGREALVRVSFLIRYHFLTGMYKRLCAVHKNSYQDGNALFPEEEARGKSCYFEAYNCITGRGDLQQIRFHWKDLEEAKEILGGKEAHCVGVHIRRTDHGPAISGSPTERFVEEIRRRIEEDPQACFYLATDDWDEQRKMEGLFGGRILSQKGKVLNRSSKEGMHSSVIDVLCLSRTKLILGSHSSIFSKFSAEYGNIELHVV